MHCIKTVNIEHEYGTTRVLLLTCMTFVIVFSFSYVLTSLSYEGWHSDHYLWLFAIGVILLYPVHKGFHYIFLFSFGKSTTFRLKIKFHFIPVLHMRIKAIVPKRLYISSLVMPFFCLNTLLLGGAFLLPAYGHFFCLLLGFHCSICVLDFLTIKTIWYTPKNTHIEETPRGYEILIPE